jgi:hypothetical protein
LNKGDEVEMRSKLLELAEVALLVTHCAGAAREVVVKDKVPGSDFGAAVSGVHCFLLSFFGFSFLLII